MGKPNIGDIVKINGDDKSIFIVVNTVQLETSLYDGIDICEYEIIKIYPIDKISKYMTVSQGGLTLHAKKNDKDHALILKFIQKDRERNGIYGVPEFVQVLNQNININADNEGVKISVIRHDIIRYDLIKTVDECLDAINDLNMLYEMFDDDYFLTAKKQVYKRIIRLKV